MCLIVKGITMDIVGYLITVAYTQYIHKSLKKKFRCIVMFCQCIASFQLFVIFVNDMFCSKMLRLLTAICCASIIQARKRN